MLKSGVPAEDRPAEPGETFTITSNDVGPVPDALWDGLVKRAAEPTDRTPAKPAPAALPL